VGKLKTKSCLKRRIKVTGTGKILAAGGYRRHNLTNRTNKALRQSRGTHVLSIGETKIIKKMNLIGN